MFNETIFFMFSVLVSDLNENRRQKIIVAVLVISGILIFFSLLFCIWKKTMKKGNSTPHLLIVLMQKNGIVEANILK